MAIFWELAARLLHSPMFVPLSLVLPAWWSLLASGELWQHSIASMTSVAIGFGMALSIGLPIGCLMALVPAVRDIVSPVVDVMRPIAALTLFPLILLIMGLGPTARAVVIFWTAWPAIVLNSEQAIREVDRSVVEAARVEGCSGWQAFWHVSRPLATSTILTGVRIGLSGGYISLVAAEMLGAQAGLGYAVMVYSQTFRFPIMYAMILTIGLWGLLMNLGLAWIQTATSYEEDTHVSSFIRFGDRAGAYLLDTIRVRQAKG